MRRSRATRDFAADLGKPCLHLSRDAHGDTAAEMLAGYIVRHAIQVLNVAGPRSSGESEVAEYVERILMRAIGPNTGSVGP